METTMGYAIQTPSYFTMHANNANQTIERIVNLYPQNLHKQLFMDLSLNMRAVISQRLIKGSESRRVAAVEVLLNTPHIADLISKVQLAIRRRWKAQGRKVLKPLIMLI